MLNDKLIVLRDKNSLVDLSDPYSRASKFSRLSGPLSPELQIDLEVSNKEKLYSLKRDPRVNAIAPPMPVRLVKPSAAKETELTDAGNMTWGIKATGAGESPFTGEGISVAVLDTGIDAEHEAFTGVELIQKDFTGSGNGDEVGHGTHCAGTIFGRPVNGCRFGAAPGIKRALIGKVLDRTGGGSSDRVCQAIQWAVNQGANVISLSLGICYPTYARELIELGFPSDIATSKALMAYSANIRLFEKLVEFVRARGQLSNGTIIVAAAGNGSRREENSLYEITVSPPAAADGIVSVGALGRDGNALKVADFSNTGPNIMAPGVDIFSAKSGGGYREWTGTSMASPHVAGLAALWAEKLLKTRGYINPDELIARLIGNAETDRLVEDFDPMDVGAGLAQAPTG